jgi:uncharacterized protein YjhX (UPF0386 family)
MSCDPSGNVFLSNRYEYAVTVRGHYDYNNTVIENSINLPVGESFAIASMGHDEYSHISAIRIETADGILLAEYPLEYLSKLRKAYKIKKNQQEFWQFSEKGLFLKTKDINRRFNFESEKIAEYYRSDEAVKDQQEILKKLEGANR